MRNFVSLKVVERGTTPRRLLRELDKATAAGLQAVAEWHHRENVPRRFTVEHGRKARYASRSRDYQQRKRREGKGDDPMVYTGRTRARANVARISSNSKRSRLSYSIPALNFKVGRPGRKRTMRSEFEKVLYTERQAGQRIAVDRSRQYLNKNSTRVTRRVL